MNVIDIHDADNKITNLNFSHNDEITLVATTVPITVPVIVSHKLQVRTLIPSKSSMTCNNDGGKIIL